MNNFFSGNNMANEIMQKTSPALQLKEYVHNYAVGTPIPEFHPERVDPVYETTKPFVNLRTPREEIVPIIPLDSHYDRHLSMMMRQAAESGAEERRRSEQYEERQREARGQAREREKAMYYVSDACEESCDDNLTKKRPSIGLAEWKQMGEICLKRDRETSRAFFKKYGVIKDDD